MKEIPITFNGRPATRGEIEDAMQAIETHLRMRKAFGLVQPRRGQPIDAWVETGDLAEVMAAIRYFTKRDAVVVEIVGNRNRVVVQGFV